MRSIWRQRPGLTIRYLLRAWPALAVTLPWAIVMTLAVLYSQNSLFLNDQWIVQKRMLKMGLMGGDEFLLTRAPLAGNRLNLASYFGYQDVVSREIFAPRAIQFDFKIPENSYLDLTFNRDDQKFDGWRLSRGADRPSLLYAGLDDGRLTTTWPIPAPAEISAMSSGWHHATIRALADGGRLRFTVDQNDVGEVSTFAFRPGRIGFRAGLAGALVDHPEIMDAEGNRTRLSFTNSKHWRPLLLLNWTGVFLLAAGFSWFVNKKARLMGRHRLFPWILASLIGTTTVGVWYAFDFFSYSRLIYTENGVTHRLMADETDSPPNSFEEFRFVVFKLWYALAGGQTISRQGLAAEGYPLRRLWRGPFLCHSDDICAKGQTEQPRFSDSDALGLPTYRILFVGTSQTVGAGARTLDETFFARVHHAIREQMAGTIDVESLNISASGSSAQTLAQSYEGAALDPRPDIVVINLGNNDLDSATFAANVIRFLRLNKSLHIKTVLVQEPNDPHYLGGAKGAKGGTLLTNHRELEKLGDRFHVPVYSLHAFLSDRTQTEDGALWWDRVHLTSYGQDVVAQWLAPKLIVALRADPPTRNGRHAAGP